MSLNRLKRQDFHTCMCAAALFVLWIAVFCARGLPVAVTMVFLGTAAIAGLAVDAFDVSVRTEGALAIRLLCACTPAFLVTATAFANPGQAAVVYVEAILTGGIWLIAAKHWMRREICPGWTLLVYDGPENLARAERLAQSRNDLIAVTGRILWTNPDEIGHIVEIYRIPQLVICLKDEKKELLDECRKRGITAFVGENPKEKGYRLDRSGIYYVRPVPPVWKRWFYKKGKNGVLKK